MSDLIARVQAMRDQLPRGDAALAELLDDVLRALRALCRFRQAVEAFGLAASAEAETKRREGEGL